jgi:hypothetical protein
VAALQVSGASKCSRSERLRIVLDRSVPHFLTTLSFFLLPLLLLLCSAASLKEQLGKFAKDCLAGTAEHRDARDDAGILVAPSNGKWCSGLLHINLTDAPDVLTKAPGADADLFDMEVYVSLVAPSAVDEFHAWEAAQKKSMSYPESLLRTTKQEMIVYKARGHGLASKYPNLETVFKYPDAWAADVRGRFAKQKALTPDRPYDFDFSDVGMPTLLTIQKFLRKETVTLTKKRAKTEGERKWYHRGWLAHPIDEKIREYTVGLELLALLQTETDEIVASGTVTYIRMNELGYFCGRALGAFDEEGIGFRDRQLLKIDRALQGLIPRTIDEDLKRYKENTFKIFDKMAFKISGFQKVQQIFDDGMFNKVGASTLAYRQSTCLAFATKHSPFIPSFLHSYTLPYQDEMEMIVIPTCDHLNKQTFNRLLSYDIYLAGVTVGVFPADGFVRPGGDFWLHDIRHSSSMFGKRKMYEVKHKLTQEQRNKFKKAKDVWAYDLEQKYKALDDQNLAASISFFNFNFHHDRGYQEIPSSFTAEKRDYISSLLHHMLRISGQTAMIRFHGGLEQLDKAYDWLQKYWLARMPDEEAILHASPNGKPGSLWKTHLKAYGRNYDDEGRRLYGPEFRR